MSRAAFFCICCLIPLVGISCVQTQINQQNNQQKTSEQSLEVFGAISEINVEKNTLNIILPNGNSEEIDMSLTPITQQQVGELATISGIREPSTQKILSKKLSIMNLENIVITSPTAESTVTSPLVIFGFVKSSSNTFTWQISKTDEDAIMAKGVAQTNGKQTDHYQPFRLDVFLPAMTETTFTIQFSSQTKERNSTVNLPLHLLTTATSDFQIYLTKELTSSAQCKNVTPVKRSIAKTSALGKAALISLLEGPTEKEFAEGYRSRIPWDTFLQTFALNNDHARIDFSNTLETIKSECERKTAKAQIKETLLQFPFIQSVILGSDEKEERL